MVGHRYIRAVVAGLGSGGAGMALGLLALWLTTQVMDKAAFGEFSIALMIVMILASVLASGPEGVILYRCSRDEIYPGSSAAYAGQSLYVALLSGVGASAVVFAAAGGLATLFGKPGVADWLRALAPVIALDALRIVLAAWNQANQNSVRATLLRNSAPYAIRCAAVGTLALAYAGDLAPEPLVSAAYVSAVALTLALAVVLSDRTIWRPARTYSAWDTRYCLKLVANGVAARPQRMLDVLLMGALGSAAATAEYMVASRLAQLPTLVKQAAELLLVPRIGMLLSRGELAQLTREYAATRGLMFMAGLGAMALFAVAGVWVLQTFGQDGYAGGFGPLMVLAAATLVRAGFGASGQMLNIGGFAGWTLWSTVASTTVLVVVGVAAIPVFGGLGGALAALASALASNVMVAAVLRWKVTFTALDAASAGLLILAIGIGVSTAVGLLNPPTGSAATAGLALLLALRHRADVKHLYALLRAPKPLA